MAEKTEITSADAETEKVVAPPHIPEDGFVDENGETFVHEFDADGNYTGWHKLPSKEALAARDGH